MFKNVASQKLIVFAFDSTTNLPKTGDAANLTAYVSKDYGSVTVLGDTSATEMDATNAKGYYLFDLTQSETNADTLLFSAKSSTSNIVVIAAPATVFTLPANFTAQAISSAGGVTLADGVSHGGTLGSGTATLALSRLSIVSQSSNTDALTVTGNGSGDGAKWTGGATGNAFELVGGGTSGDALKATTTSGHGFNITATGTSKHALQLTGAAAAATNAGGHGINATGGAASTSSGGTSGVGIKCTGGAGAASTNGAGEGVTLIGGGTTTVSGGNGFSSTGTGNLNGVNFVGAGSGSGLLLTKGSSGDGFKTDTINATSTLTVSGTTSLAAVSTSGTVTFNAFTVTNALTVSGATTLTGAVTASNASNNIVGIDVAKIGGTSQTAKDLGAINVTNLNTLSSHDPGATLGTSTLTQTQVTGGAYALNSSSFAFNSGLDFTTTQKAATLARVTLVDTVTTVTNQLTAAAIATGVWQDTTAGDFTAANSVGKSLMNGVSLGTGLTIARCTLTDTLTTYTGNTPQTGDSYAIVNSGTFGNAAIKGYVDDIGVAGAGLTAIPDSAGTTTLLSRIPSGIFTGITSLAQWLGLIAGKQTGNSTARTEIRATGAGSGTFDETTDSIEALRDRGDAAWITATGFSTHSAADVWAVATRVLTANTNLNDPTTAQIAAAVLTTQMTESYAADGTAPTLAQAMFLTQQSLHEFAISGTTRTVKKLDGSSTAATFTLDSSTAPTSTTRAS